MRAPPSSHHRPPAARITGGDHDDARDTVRCSRAQAGDVDTRRDATPQGITGVPAGSLRSRGTHRSAEERPHGPAGRVEHVQIRGRRVRQLVEQVHTGRDRDGAEDGVKVHRRELSYGHFMRRFTMPDDADDKSVMATFANGILDVVVAKTKVSAPTVREIAIR
jgi:hypothetical protein